MNAAVESARAEAIDAVPAGAACAAHDDAAASFVCHRCGTFGCPACEFATVKGKTVCRACAAKGLDEPIPWERRKEIGNVRAFWETAKLTMRSPVRFFRTPTTHDGVFAAVAHGVISTTVGLFLSYVAAGLLLLAMGGGISLVDEPGFGEGGLFLAGYGCAMLGVSPFLAVAAGPANALFGLVIAAACAHGTLALFKKTGATFEDTLRVCSYANAPYLFTWVPVAGSFAWFWVVGIEVIGLREVHRCGTDWAAVAALAYRVAFFLAAVVGYALLFFGFVSVLEGASQPPPH